MQLHQRISLLEIALAQSHAKESSKAHPLIAAPYIYAANAIDPGAKTAKEGLPEEEDDIGEGAFGTLTIGSNGEAHFVGSFAGSEYLRDGDASQAEAGSPIQVSTNLRGPSDNTQERWTTQASTMPLRTAWYGSGRFLPLQPANLLGGLVKPDIKRLRQQLPDWEMEGRSMVESYWENVNWM